MTDVRTRAEQEPRTRVQAAAVPQRGRREMRVLALAAVIVVLSMVDLYFTLLYLHSGGMGEGNPLARWLIAWDTPALLIAWKAATVGLAITILYSVRRQRLGELGAWTCCLILVWLTIRWDRYTYEVPQITSVLHAVSSMESTRWVRMGD